MLELRKCEQAILDVIMEKKQGIVDFDEGISVMQNVDNQPVMSANPLHTQYPVVQLIILPLLSV